MELPSSKGALPLPLTTSTNETDGEVLRPKRGTDDPPSDEDELKSSQSDSSSPASLRPGVDDGEKGVVWGLRVGVGGAPM
jgi:hypothetical protein